MTIGDRRPGRRVQGVVSTFTADPLPGFLADLAPGTRATVLEVVAAGSEATARRLGELGFTPGAVAEVVRRAPLRDPVIYRVKDYEICLRRAQTSRIRTAEVSR
jgi:ferrous iron transport protein A